VHACHATLPTHPQVLTNTPPPRVHDVFRNDVPVANCGLAVPDDTVPPTGTALAGFTAPQVTIGLREGAVRTFLYSDALCCPLYVYAGPLIHAKVSPWPQADTGGALYTAQQATALPAPAAGQTATLRVELGQATPVRCCPPDRPRAP
jgi:hypothetical protein